MLVGVDIGGTKIRAALISRFKVVKEITILTEVNKGKKKILENILEAINYVFNNKVTFIGVAVPGMTDGKKILEAPNVKPFNGFNLSEVIKKKYKVPCMLENDTNAFTLAEYSFLKRKNPKVKNIVGITLGTGVGGGLIINGELYKGSNLSGAEIGHMTIASNKIRCKCGNYDCFEVYCNGRAMERYYTNLTHVKLSSYDIVASYDKDKNAKKAIEEYAHYLGVGLVNITNIFNPEYIIIGGGISQVKEIYKPSISYVKKYALKPSRNVKIIKSQLNKDATVIGAAMIRDYNEERKIQKSHSKKCKDKVNDKKKDKDNKDTQKGHSKPLKKSFSVLRNRK